MWSILALGATERLVNHLIDLDAITRVQLNELKGQLLRVVIDQPQLSVDVFFDDGTVRLEPTATGHAQTPSIFEQRTYDQAQQSIKANAILHVNDIVELVKLFVSEDIGTLPIEGDYHLLQKLQHTIQTTSPDLAAHLSPWVGAKVAHEIAKFQQLPRIAKQSLQSKLFFAEDFLKEDSGLFAPRWQMDQLQHQTRQLNQDLDRLTAKVHTLKAKVQSKTR